ncbi:hypothetical protein [Frankia sp. CcI49]|uniref:hypothetical protein n=1 Tax=Frankia sp. CcI49 TaxID=1745382 RepID=UPI000975E3B7|nr:hypothetical protein [Frankia sp. CcI49]
MVSLAEWAFGRLIVVIVAASTVTAVGVGTVAFFIGRQSVDTSPEASASAEPNPVVPSAQASAAPTAVVPTPDDVPTPTGEAGPVGAPTRVNEFGVPVGYPHTSSGAISACGNYYTAYNNRANRSQEKIREFFSSIADPRSVETLASGILRVDQENAAILGVPSIQDPLVNFDARPLGYQIEASSDSEAKILVWGAISLGVYDSADPVKQAQVRWGSEICQVRWQQDDWKLINADDGPDGPLLHSRSAGDFKEFVVAGGPQS